jgi:predicted ATPase
LRRAQTQRISLRGGWRGPYQLLSPDEQTLFRGLGPFAGGARLETIESVFPELDIEPIETVAALVDKSLLRRRDDPDGQPRFWMLETVREYASEALARKGEADAVGSQHAAYFLERRASRACTPAINQLG